MKINEKFTKKNRPIKILQFGEGNFLRCFVDWMIQKLNDANLGFDSDVVVVQPIAQGLVKKLQEQDGLYTVLLEGINQGEIIKTNEVIDVISDYINPYTDYDRFLNYSKSEELTYIISNTTEAGIVLDSNDLDLTNTPNSYPGKLLAFLKTRYEHFNKSFEKGLDIITCELIDKNGEKLKEVLIELAKLNNLDNQFINWIIKANRFYNTLVDRIVPGYPRLQAENICKTLGYQDELLVKGEPFHLWVIEDHYNLKERLPLDKILNVKFVEDVTPYKIRKVKILNGSHTLLTPVSYLSGYNTVGETMNDELLKSFVLGFIYKEVIPTIDLPYEDMVKFSEAVIERYQNPFVRHELMSIALNSITKFKTRILPTIIDNLTNQHFPSNALYSLAALIVFYRGLRQDEIIELKDNPEIIAFFKAIWLKYDEDRDVTSLVKKVLSWKEHWEIDLTILPNVLDFVAIGTKEILENGIINDFFKNNCHFR